MYIQIGFEIALYVLEGILLLTNMYLSYSTKNVPGALNEALCNIKAIAIVVIVAVIVFPLNYVPIGLTYGARQLIVSAGIFLAVFLTLCFLYGYKIAVLIAGYDIDATMMLSKKGTVVAAKNVLKDEESTKVSGSFKYGNTKINPFEAEKSLNLLNRRQVCRDQVFLSSTSYPLTPTYPLTPATPILTISFILDHYP
jgi:hypothetical protein